MPLRGWDTTGALRRWEVVVGVLAGLLVGGVVLWSIWSVLADGVRKLRGK